MSNISSALLITLIGMGLVFVSILLLWGLMALMVRLFPEQAAAEEPEGAAPAELVTEPASDRKREAAAAAVAVALQFSRQPIPSAALRQPATQASAWQTVMRANQLRSKQQRGRVR